MNSKVPLQGEELEEFLAKERAAKEKEAAAQAAEQNFEQQRMLEADEEDTDSDEDSDDEDEVERALATADLMDTEQDITSPASGGGFAEPGSQSRRSKRARGADDGDWGLDADEGLNKQQLSFDIYLKGNVSRATSFFKSADGQSQQRFRMFPYVEKKRRVDDYGELIDVGMWLRKGKVFEAEAESDEMKELKRNQVEEEAKVSSTLLG
jgi:cleavage and polyadenylation specificity factor subunit 2